MVSVSFPPDDSVEAIMTVSSIINDSNCAVWFNDSVIFNYGYENLFASGTLCHVRIARTCTGRQLCHRSSFPIGSSCRECADHVLCIRSYILVEPGRIFYKFIVTVGYFFDLSSTYMIINMMMLLNGKGNGNCQNSS